jgi:hypothetical protein
VHRHHPEQRDAAGEVDAGQAVRAAARHRVSVLGPPVRPPCRGAAAGRRQVPWVGLWMTVVVAQEGFSLFTALARRRGSA